MALNDLQIASPELSIATKDAGAGGIGSLLVGGGDAYHTMRDNPANLDVASLQAYGDNTLALARYFGNGTLDPKPTSPELVAFTVPPNTVISYGRGLALALALVLVGLFVALMVLGLRRYLLRAWGLVLGFGLALVSLPVALTADVLAWLAVVAVNPAYRAPMGRGYYGAAWTLLFLTFVTLAVTAAVRTWAAAAPAGAVRRQRCRRGPRGSAAAWRPHGSGPARLQLRLRLAHACRNRVAWLDCPWIIGRYPALAVAGGAVGGRAGSRDGRCRPRVPDLLGLRCAGKRAAVAGIPGPRAADRRRPEPGARAAPALPCPTTPLDDSRCPGRVGRRVPWRAAHCHPVRCRHHSPTTSNTASTPTPSRPPGSAQGAVQTAGQGSSSPTAMRQAAPPSRPGTTSSSSTTSSSPQPRR